MANKHIEQLIESMRRLTSASEVARLTYEIEKFELEQQENVERIYSRSKSLLKSMISLAESLDTFDEGVSGKKEEFIEAATTLASMIPVEISEAIRISFIVGYICRIKAESPEMVRQIMDEKK